MNYKRMGMSIGLGYITGSLFFIVLDNPAHIITFAIALVISGLWLMYGNM